VKGLHDDEVISITWKNGTNKLIISRQQLNSRYVICFAPPWSKAFQAISLVGIFISPWGMGKPPLHGQPEVP